MRVYTGWHERVMLVMMMIVLVICGLMMVMMRMRLLRVVVVVLVRLYAAGACDIVREREPHQVGDVIDNQLQLVLHQADGARADDVTQHDEILELQVVFERRHEPVLDVAHHLLALVLQAVEVDEEPRAHVLLEALDRVWVR